MYCTLLLLSPMHDKNFGLYTAKPAGLTLYISCANMLASDVTLRQYKLSALRGGTEREFV